MKLKVSKEYYRRLKKVLKSKLNGGNLVQGVNTWAVSLYIQQHLLVGESASCRLQIGKLGSCLHYMEDWTQSLMLTDCIYLEKNSGIDLIAIEDYLEQEVRGLEVYVHGSEERLLQTAKIGKTASKQKRADVFLAE